MHLSYKVVSSPVMILTSSDLICIVTTGCTLIVVACKAITRPFSSGEVGEVVVHEHMRYINDI